MWLFYVLALIPVSIGAIVWIKNKQVTWWEWVVPSAICFLMAVIFQLVSVWGMTTDIETWSGRIFKTTHHPRWVERYTTTETYTVTVGSGKNRRTETRTRTVTKYRTHPEHWIARGNFGSQEIDFSISRSRHEDIKKCFGGAVESKRGHKPGRVRGDPNIYITYNRTDYLLPVTTLKRWENRVKAAPSIFSYSKPPKDVKVFDYPKNSNSWQSNRLMGTAAKNVGIYAWDCMNSRLGPIKKVNVILIGFGGKDSQIAHYQESAWLGGKKNDLVLCYGDGWSYVFGWTEQEIVKRNLETILLKSNVDNKLISTIEEEIKSNYIIKDWSKFDYIKVEPPTWSYFVFLLILAASQIGFYAWATLNSYRTREGY